MRPSRWFRLLAVIAAIGLFVAACSTEDDDPETSSGGNGDDTEEEASEPATCQGEPGQAPSQEPVGGGEADGSGVRVGMVLDVGGVDDDSFNEAANNGLEAAQTDFGIEAQLLEPNEDGSNRGDLLTSLAEDDYDLIIGVGFLFAESMQPLAEQYPDTSFAIVDDASFEAPNVTSLVFAEEEGSFLVGAAAALTSGTDQVGFIGGVNTPLIQKFQAGFEAGVAEINPDAEVQVNYISEPPDFNGFADPASAKTIADGMYADEVDVVYHAAGGSGSGLFEAALSADRLAIGVDSDQYQQVDAATQPCILTSMLKRVDQAVYSAIEDLANGELEAGSAVFDLASGGIDFATDGGQLDDISDELEDLKQQIIDGEIEVPDVP